MKVQPIVGTRVCLAWLPAPPPLLLLFLLLFPLLELFLVLFLLRLLHMYLLLLTCYCCSLSFISFLSCSSSFFSPSPSPSTCTCTCSPCKHLTDLALVPRTKHTPRVRIARPVDCVGLLRCECFSLLLVQIMIKFPVNFLIEARQMKLLQLIESLHAA